MGMVLKKSWDLIAIIIAIYGYSYGLFSKKMREYFFDWKKLLTLAVKSKANSVFYLFVLEI